MIRRPDPSLLDLYDALLFDLDGTLMHGAQPIPHAAESVEKARAAGRSVVFATNNASRTPQQAAEHLAVVGIPARPEEFVTSPQVASRLLADRFDPGAKVLVVEDTTTTGNSPLTAVKALREAGAEVVAVATVVDRETGADKVIADAGMEYRHLLGLADLGLE